MREIVSDTLCAGTSTVTLEPAGLSFTVAAKETTIASSSRRTVKRSASGKLKVGEETQTNFKSNIQQIRANNLFCRSSSWNDGTMIVRNSSSAKELFFLGQNVFKCQWFCLFLFIYCFLEPIQALLTTPQPHFHLFSK